MASPRQLQRSLDVIGLLIGVILPSRLAGATARHQLPVEPEPSRMRSAHLRLDRAPAAGLQVDGEPGRGCVFRGFLVGGCEHDLTIRARIHRVPRERPAVEPDFALAFDRCHRSIQESLLAQ